MHNLHPADARTTTVRFTIAIVVCIFASLYTQFIVERYNPVNLPDAKIEVTDVYFQAGIRLMPELPSDYGKPITLPKVWKETGHPRGGNAGNGWYTASIPLNVPPNRLWIVYFPNISSNSAVYLNGEILGRARKLGEKIGQMRQRPLYLNIPNGMLSADENILQIQIDSGFEFFGSIEPFYLGPEADFISVYSSHYFIKVTIVKIIGSLLLFTFLTTGFIWLLRRNETLYGWFSLSCLLWSIVIFTDFTTDISSTQGFLKVLFRYQAITLFSVLLLIVINRYLGKHPNRIESMIAGTGILVCVILVAISDQYMHSICNYLVGAFALSIITYCFIAVIYNTSQSSAASTFLIAFAISVIFFFSIGDLQEALSFDSQKFSGMTTHYSAPIYVFVLGYKLIRDFVDARSHAEELNQNLEKRIEEKTAELQTSFTKLQKLQKQQILAEERDRLITEMHDGLGGHLVSAMSMLDHDQVDKSTVSGEIKTALADLRMMIDALDPDTDDLAMVLGGFRQRLEQSLKHTQIELIWNVNDVPETVDSIPPYISLQILRILQEAITNAIKYAQCTKITVSTGTLRNKIFLSIEDNGIGLSTPADDNCGRGIGNMKKRAANINADLTFNNTGNGLKIALLMPY